MSPICEWSQCTIGTLIRAFWLILRRNICFLWSLIDWIVATNQTIAYVFVQTPVQFPRIFMTRNGWNNQIFLTISTQTCSSPKCSNRSSTNAKTFSFSRAWKSFQGFMFICQCIVSLHKRNLQSIKYIMWQNFITKLDCCLTKKDSFGSKEETSWHPKKG